MTHLTQFAFKILIVLLACSRIATADPTELLSKIELAYGEHPRQILDLYRAPLADDDSASPVVVYFHGGGFNHGDKAKVSTALIRRMHKHGISVASANYRFTTTAPLPVSMLDGVRVIQYLRHVAAEHRLDASRIATLGSSAGGGIALFVALHDDFAVPDSMDLVERHSSRVTCALTYSAQVSYDPRFWQAIGLATTMKQRHVERFYGPPSQEDGDFDRHAAYEASSPIAFLTADDPPLRLDYSTSVELNSDTTKTALLHHPLHGIELKRRCDVLGVECDLSYPEALYEGETGYDFLIRHLSNAPQQ